MPAGTPGASLEQSTGFRHEIVAQLLRAHQALHPAIYHEMYYWATVKNSVEVDFLLRFEQATLNRVRFQNFKQHITYTGS